MAQASGVIQKKFIYQKKGKGIKLELGISSPEHEAKCFGILVALLSI